MSRERLKWLCGLGPRPEELPTQDPGQEEGVRFAARRDTESVTINNLDVELLEFVRQLAEAEGDPLSVFMRKRLLEGLGAYLAGKNRNAWQAYKFLRDARENF